MMRKRNRGRAEAQGGSRSGAGTGRRTVARAVLVAALAAVLSIAGWSTGLAKSSMSQLYGEVKAKNAEEIQVQVEVKEGRKTYAVSKEVTIQDEEGYVKQMSQVPLGVEVVLHLEKGKIVGMTLLSD